MALLCRGQIASGPYRPVDHIHLLGFQARAPDLFFRSRIISTALSTILPPNPTYHQWIAKPSSYHLLYVASLLSFQLRTNNCRVVLVRVHPPTWPFSPLTPSRQGSRPKEVSSTTEAGMESTKDWVLAL